MKKTSKLFGAVALSAALALGTAVPAFALDEEAVNGDAGKQVTSGQASSDTTSTVNLTTYIGQINVAVPTSITIAAQANGGDAKAPKTAEIRNFGSDPIRVTSVQKGTTGANASYKLVAFTATNLTSGGEPSTNPSGNKGDYAITLQPATKADNGDLTPVGGDDSLVDLVAGKTTPDGTKSIKDWTIAAKGTGEDYKAMPIEIKAKTSKITDYLNVLDNPVAVHTVVFTIEAGEGTAA